jgi:homoserine dehydrogenase
LARVGVRELHKSRPIDIPTGCLTTDLDSIVSDPEIGIVVEVLGGLEPARSLILKAITQGKHVVTANKAVIARYGDEIFTAANQAGVYVMLEAAVGGGIPILQPLKQALGVNRIHSLTGIVNGTTNYILTRMQREGVILPVFWPMLSAWVMPRLTPLPISMVWMPPIRSRFSHPWPLAAGLNLPMSIVKAFVR